MGIEASTPVLTSTGWMPIELLKPNDIVFGQNGYPKKVSSTQVYPEGDCYEIAFNDGLTIVGDKNMVLHIQNKATRNVLSEGYRAKQKLKTVEEMSNMDLRNSYDSRFALSVPTAEPIQLPEQTLPIPPFIVGVWFARINRTNRLSVHKDKVKDLAKKFRQHGHSLVKIKNRRDFVVMEVRPSINHSFLTTYPTPQHTIPDEYLYGSVEQRLELLRGVFYLRKTILLPKTTRIRYCCRDYTMIRKIQGVVESLGIRTLLEEYPSGVRYRLTFKTNLPVMVEELPKQNVTRYKRRYINKITKIKPSRRVHVEAGGPFLVGEGFIPAC